MNHKQQILKKSRTHNTPMKRKAHCFYRIYIVSVWTLFVLCIMPSLVLAQSIFNGTWEFDASSVKSSSKNTEIIKDGVFSCKTCTPPYHIKADGKFHRVVGQSGYDMESIKVVNDNTVLDTREKDGKKVGDRIFSVAPDGKTGIETFHSYNNGHTFTGKVTLIRVAPGPAGSHATSGTWRLKQVNASATSDLKATYKIEDGIVNFRSSMGESYHAKLDGKKVPVHGSEEDAMVSVTMPDPYTLIETYWVNGKSDEVDVITVASDGKTGKIVSCNPKNGYGESFSMNRQ